MDCLQIILQPHPWYKNLREQVRNPSSLSITWISDCRRKSYDLRLNTRRKHHQDNTEEKEIVTGFNIPFDEKGVDITFLALVSALNPHKLDFSEDDKLQLTANDHNKLLSKKVEKFLKIFFTNYTNQIILIWSLKMDIIANSTFKTIITLISNRTVMICQHVQASTAVRVPLTQKNFTFALRKRKDLLYYKTRTTTFWIMQMIKNRGELCNYKQSEPSFGWRNLDPNTAVPCS